VSAEIAGASIQGDVLAVHAPPRQGHWPQRLIGLLGVPPAITSGSAGLSGLDLGRGRPGRLHELAAHAGPALPLLAGPTDRDRVSDRRAGGLWRSLHSGSPHPGRKMLEVLPPEPNDAEELRSFLRF